MQKISYVFLVFVCLRGWLSSHAHSQSVTLEPASEKSSCQLLTKCLHNRLSQCERNVETLQQRLDELSTTVNQLKTGQSDVRESAFSAHDLTADGTTHVGQSAGDRLIFYYPTVNVGGQYSPITGEYTCPHTGLYFFSVSLWSDDISAQRGRFGPVAAIMNKHGKLAYLELWNRNTEDVASVVSTSVVTRCVAGDKVWVESIWSNTRLYTTNTGRGNVFSGFLIAREDTP